MADETKLSSLFLFRNKIIYSFKDYTLGPIFIGIFLFLEKKKHENV